MVFELRMSCNAGSMSPTIRRVVKRWQRTCSNELSVHACSNAIDDVSGQEEFVRIVKALGPYLDKLVFVGAWCHRLLQFHPLAVPPTFEPLMTEDADIATPDNLPSRSPNLDGALQAGGFKARLSGDGNLPVTKCHPEGDENGLYIEFVAQLQGAGVTRSGEPNDILAVSGVTAQKLRHVDLLLLEPWELELSEPRGFEVGTNGIVVQVANPASYLVQKVLTLRKRRSPAKQSKDALYIHDTLTMFGGSFAALREQAPRVLERLPRKTLREFHELCTALFRDKALMIGAEMIAAATGRANPPSAETIATVCAVGLAQIFAP